MLMRFFIKVREEIGERKSTKMAIVDEKMQGKSILWLEKKNGKFYTGKLRAGT